MSQRGKDYWETMGLLRGVDMRRSSVDLALDIEAWLDQIIAKRNARYQHLQSRNQQKGKVRCSGPRDVDELFTRAKIRKILCEFSHPHLRSKLERLMGSNIVSLTDREYMQKLQERILEDYGTSMAQRIIVRQKEEMERVKHLVLTGKIPLDQAPPEMANHPVMQMEVYCNRIIAERRAKLKIQRIYIPTHIYSDDTPDPPSGLSIESGHMFRSNQDRLCAPPSRYLDRSDYEEREAGYMFTDDEFERKRYENPNIVTLKDSETVEEMYTLADEIIGELKTIKDPIELSAAVKSAEKKQ